MGRYSVVVQGRCLARTDSLVVCARWAASLPYGQSAVVVDNQTGEQVPVHGRGAT